MSSFLSKIFKIALLAEFVSLACVFHTQYSMKSKYKFELEITFRQQFIGLCRYNITFLGVLLPATRARIFILIRSPKIDSKEPILSGCGGPVRQPYSYSVPGPHRLFKNSNTVYVTFITRLFF
jgi:hypothetical protein